MHFESVLYVDDDSDICSVVQATLRLVAGLKVYTANSGEAAIDLAYEFRPDLLLMDVMMPGLDGPSTFERMHGSALLADTPVIFMTAKALPAEISQFLRLGAIGVIVKPFDPLKLYEDLCALWSNEDSVHRSSTASSRRPQVHAQENSLTISFLERARADVINLAKLIGRAQTGDRSVFKEIERVAHSIHGAGAMFGFPKVSLVGGQIARVAAEHLAENADRTSECEITILWRLLDFSNRLAQHVEAAWHIAPQSDAMFQAPAGAR